MRQRLRRRKNRKSVIQVSLKYDDIFFSNVNTGSSYIAQTWSTDFENDIWNTLSSDGHI